MTQVTSPEELFEHELHHAEKELTKRFLEEGSNGNESSGKSSRR